MQNCTYYKLYSLGSILLNCRTLVHTGTSAEPSDVPDQIRTDALCAHFMHETLQTGTEVANGECSDSQINYLLSNLLLEGTQLPAIYY